MSQSLTSQEAIGLTDKERTQLCGQKEKRGFTPEGLIEELKKSVKDFRHLMLRIV